MRDLAALCLASFVVSGCMVGPDYDKPATAVNTAWSEPTAADGTLTDEETSPAWWKVFHDPVLNALIDQAYHENLTLRTAGLRVIEARARRGIAVGQFFPQSQSAFGGVGVNQLSANGPIGDVDRNYAYDEIGLQAVWEIDVWGKFRRGIEAADAEVLASLASYDQVLVSVVSEVASTYVFLRAQQERLAIAQNNAELQRATRDLTRIRFRAGAVSELDASQAEATLLNTEAQIPALQNSIRETTLILCVLLGQSPSDLASLLAPAGAEPPRIPDPPARIAVGIPADLLRRRPDVRAAERICSAQSARIGAAEAELLPSISIAGSTGFSSSDYDFITNPELGNIFDGNSFQGFIGLQIDWPILNYGRIIGAVRAQDAAYEQAVTIYQETVIRAAGEVEAGISKFLRSRERRGKLADSVAAARRSVEISMIQYRAGAVDYIRVNDSQIVQLQQEDQLVDARASICLGAIAAYRSMGGGWEIRGSSELVDPATIERMRKTVDWGDVLSPTWSKGSDLGFKRPTSDLEGAAPPETAAPGTAGTPDPTKKETR